MDCEDKKCIGLQRRIDDETKRRAVRRDAQPFLKGLSVVLLLSEDDIELSKAIVMSHGGIVKDKINRFTKLVILGSGFTREDFVETFDNAEKSGIAIVKDEWLIDCIKQKKMLMDDLEPYKVVGTSFKVEKEEEKVLEPPPAKKSKLIQPSQEDIEMKISSEEINKFEQQTSKNSISKSQDSSNLILKNQDSFDSETNKFYEYLKSDIQLIGICFYPQDNTHFVFILNILTINIDGSFEGIMKWPTLKNSSLKTHGTISKNKIKYTEYEIIKGEDEVESGGVYELEIVDKDTFKGTVSSDGVNGTLEGSMVSLDDQDKSINDGEKFMVSQFNSKSSYNGKIIVDDGFSFKITKREGNLIEGILKWTNREPTSFKGKIDGSKIDFTEILMESGKSEIISYSGLLDLNESCIRGIITSKSLNGHFTIPIII